MFISMTCLLFPVVSCLAVAEGWEKCGNKSWREKKMYGSFCFGLDAKKSQVKSRDKRVLLELAPVPGTIIPSLRTSHPFIHFHSVFYRTRNWLFSSIWYSGLFFSFTGSIQIRCDFMNTVSPFIIKMLTEKCRLNKKKITRNLFCPFQKGIKVSTQCIFS